MGSHWISIGARLILVSVCGLAAASCLGDSTDLDAGAGGNGGGGGELLREAQSAVDQQVCVTVRRGVAGGVADAFLSGDSTTWATGGEPTMGTGKSSGNNLNESLLRFDLGLLPPGVAIVSATAEWTMGWSQVDNLIAVHRVLSPWTEGTVTRANFAFPANFDPVAVTTFQSGTGGVKTVDLTALVAGWADGSIPNHGILLTEPVVNAHSVYTSEVGAVTGRPGLTVCYTCDGPCPADLCQGVVCAAQDACHGIGACDPATGLCTNPPAANGAACDDGDACTQGSTCQSGVCSGGTPTVCAPSGPCRTAGVCDPATGACSDPAAPDGTACNDGDPCTGNDVCTAGACDGSGPSTCTCVDIRRGALGNIGDAYLAGAWPGWNTGSEPSFNTGLTGGGNVNRALLSADLAGVIPPSSKILSATLRVRAGYNTVAGTVSVHRVTQPWTESTVTSTNFGAGGIDPTAVGSFDGLGMGFKQVDITPLFTATAATPTATSTPAATASCTAARRATTATA
jgi:hypothetical protein